MSGEAVVWTEGKTDIQHLLRAKEILGGGLGISFKQLDVDMGDDQLLKQCKALSMTVQERVTIFMFDRDNPDVVPKIHDEKLGYKRWGNNVFSFAIPVPEHRRAHPAVCIELYYLDADLQKADDKGRRLFLSTEFHAGSGRHTTNPHLSVGNKGKLASGKASVRILDSEVYNERHENVALSKADFANEVARGEPPFGNMDFTPFRSILDAIDAIVVAGRPSSDALFDGLGAFCDSFENLDFHDQIARATEAAIQLARLSTTIFCAAAIRNVEVELWEVSKRTKPIRQTLTDHFTAPSLSTLIRLTKQCLHLPSGEDTPELIEMRTVLAATPVLGAIGDLLDDLERAIPPDSRRGRIVVKRALRKPILEYGFAELAKYEGRGNEIATAAADTLGDANPAVWLDAVTMLTELFADFGNVPLRHGRIDRVEVDSDQFVVSLDTFARGCRSTEQVHREYTDVTRMRLETYDIQLTRDGQPRWHDIYPFLMIRNGILHAYTRTRALGYEYRAVFGTSAQLIPTKRKFSHAVLGNTTAFDSQNLFWAPVAAATSPAGVRGNIPAYDPAKFVGRRQQISEIMDEIISIPNQNGLVYGPGGVGKTTLLTAISRDVFERGLPEEAPFRNVIWVSAKRDYYDPALDVVESGVQQFRTLDQICTAILEFHEIENLDEYRPEDRRWFVLEILREGKTLLILDNFETVSKSARDEIIRFFGVDVKRALRDRPDAFKVILTSREVVPSGFHQYNLSGLDKRESKLFMTRLDESYQQTGQPSFSSTQRDQIHGATHGIPLLIKHCYGQVFEYSRPLEEVLKGLAAAGNKAVEFSFKEIFDLLEQDAANQRILVLLEVLNKPLLTRQISDILSMPEEEVLQRIGRLHSFQCVNRVPSETYDKYAINPELRLLATGLVQRSASVANEIKGAIARLPTEKNIDFSKEEFEIVMIFQEYLLKGNFVEADDFLKERLHEKPNSILLNLHYAQFLSEHKRLVDDAIAQLERIRLPSGNAPNVLRLLMNYNVRLETPNFEQAGIYAKKLQEGGFANDDVRLDAAEVFIQWGTSLKLKFDLDPIKEMLRQQHYKELADTSAGILITCADRTSHRWNYLLAQCHFLKWEYEAAKRHIDKAISALPDASYLTVSYERLQGEIIKKWKHYNRQR
jgi:tetratricopeptide (TPR) repeat protein